VNNLISAKLSETGLSVDYLFILVHLDFCKETKLNLGGEQTRTGGGDSDGARVSNVSTAILVETTDQWERKVATALYNRKWILASSTSVFTYKGTASSFFCVWRERERGTVSFISSPGSTLLSYVPCCTNLARNFIQSDDASSISQWRGIQPN
jgi:hypothetical protein